MNRAGRTRDPGSLLIALHQGHFVWTGSSGSASQGLVKSGRHTADTHFPVAVQPHLTQSLRVPSVHASSHHPRPKCQHCVKRKNSGQDPTHLGLFQVSHAAFVILKNPSSVRMSVSLITDIGI